jgi:hypothetical protein
VEKACGIKEEPKSFVIVAESMTIKYSERNVVHPNFGLGHRVIFGENLLSNTFAHNLLNASLVHFLRLISYAHQ